MHLLWICTLQVICQLSFRCIQIHHTRIEIYYVIAVIIRTAIIKVSFNLHYCPLLVKVIIITYDYHI